MAEAAAAAGGAEDGAEAGAARPWCKVPLSYAQYQEKFRASPMHGGAMLTEREHTAAVVIAAAVKRPCLCNRRDLNADKVPWTGAPARRDTSKCAPMLRRTGARALPTTPPRARAPRLARAPAPMAEPRRGAEGTQQQGSDFKHLYVPLHKEHPISLCAFISTGDSTRGIGEEPGPMVAQSGLTSKTFWLVAQRHGVLCRQGDENSLVKKKVKYYRRGVTGQEALRDPSVGDARPVLDKFALMDPNVATEETELEARLEKLQVRHALPHAAAPRALTPCGARRRG